MAVAYPPGIKQSDLGIDPNLDLTLDPNPSYKNDFDFDFGAEWAKHVIYNNIKEIEDGVPEDVLPTEKGHFCSAEDANALPKGGTRRLRVGIIGAGAAGLFTAMIFDYLNKEYQLDVDYQILEASDKIGGRLLTHHFSEERHDYYDVGAMRFPNNGIMKRTFKLFDILGMRQIEVEPNAADGDLVPYYLNAPNQRSLYNSIQVVQTDVKKPPTAEDFKIPNLPICPSKIIDDAIELYKKVYFIHGPEAFWRVIKNGADKFSVRQFLTLNGFDYNTIEFLETLNYGNRWYDQALSEMIIENLDFTTPKTKDPNKIYWWCVEGGANEIAKRMQGKVQQSNSIDFCKKVTAMSYTSSDYQQISVTVKGEQKERIYDAILNSAPLGSMQHMQLEGLLLNWGTKSAIRSLGYGASCKVGVRFKSLWWIRLFGIKGGQSRTDLPIRCCVYPSYNIKDYDPEHPEKDKGGVLLVSYTWSQEAERIGALIHRDSPAGEDELKEVLFHDLARLHAEKDGEWDYERLHKLLRSEYVTHHAYNWYADPNTVGAFAYFGPGQFKNMYPYVTRSSGKHIIIGEAASAHHAWVVGALESAVRGVYQFLRGHVKVSEAARKAMLAYERNEIPPPYGPLPAEFNWRTDKPQPVEPAAIGNLARLQVIFEKIRLQQKVDKIIPENITKDQVKRIVTVSA